MKKIISGLRINKNIEFLKNMDFLSCFNAEKIKRNGKKISRQFQFTTNKEGTLIDKGVNKSSSRDIVITVSIKNTFKKKDFSVEVFHGLQLKADIEKELEAAFKKILLSPNNDVNKSNIDDEMKCPETQEKSLEKKDLKSEDF